MRRYAIITLTTISMMIMLATTLAVGKQLTPKAKAATAVKIMPFGDSITGSPGCWRALLWANLQNNGYTNIDFVGTQPPQGCGIPYDGDNEGHGGLLASQAVSQSNFPAWLATTNPDIVLMHIGTNDVWSGTQTTTQILASYTTLVNEMRANNPNMKILVAQIIPMNPSGCSACAQGAINLNAAIPAWATSITTTASPITVVDQWTGFDDSTDTSDGVHPNDSGNQKMASKWYPPLAALLTKAGTPIPTNTATATPLPGTTPTPISRTPTPIPPTSTPSAIACKVTYAIQSQWTGGFSANITITNTSTTAINGWILKFTFPATSQSITQGWSATWSQAGQNVTVTNLSWNSSIAAGSSVGIGFNGAWSGTNPSPTNFTLNGTACING
jgi:lysophospholipase L1-like esterase